MSKASLKGATFEHLVSESRERTALNATADAPTDGHPTLRDILAASKNLLTEAEAAVEMDLAPGTLSVWRSTGRYKLPFLKIGRCVRYRREDIIEWMESRYRASGATDVSPRAGHRVATLVEA